MLININRRPALRGGGFKTASSCVCGVLQSVECAVVCGFSPYSLSGALQ